MGQSRVHAVQVRRGNRLAVEVEDAEDRAHGQSRRFLLAGICGVENVIYRHLKAGQENRRGPVASRKQSV